MGASDDTLREGRQAAEDALMALIEHGALPGVEWQGDVDAVAGALMETDQRALVVYRIPRDVAEHGHAAGVAIADQLLRLPPPANGSVVLSFDGWAEDPRALAEIPCAVALCCGLLGISDVGDGGRVLPTVNTERCTSVMRVLFDEASLDPIAWDAPGVLWVVGHAFAPFVFERTRSGWGRDGELNLALAYWLQAGCPPID
jgi:hypothetical protein